MTREEARQRKRERFTAAAELADLFRDMGGKITYAANDRGESIGEPFAARCKREGLTECRYRPEGVGK
jgi:hypothetical protein